MTRVSKNIRVYVYSSLILSVICALIFSLSYLFAFDSDIGYFNFSSFLPHWASSMAAVTLLWTFTLVITVKKGDLMADTPPFGKASNVFAALSFAGFAAYALYRFFFMRTIDTVPAIISLGSIVFGGLSLIYFLLVALKKKESSGMIFAGFAPIFWAALSMTEVYVNKNIAMNNPVKVSFMMVMIFFMLFISFELRYRLGRGKPRCFLIFSLAGVLVLLVYVLPFLLLTITGIYSLPALTAPSFLSLALLGYVLSRVFDFLSYQITPTANQPPRDPVPDQTP